MMKRRTQERRESTFAAAIIALGTLLAAAWAVHLPMFLGQDESNHYDYVLTLATAGRLIPGGEGHTGTDTHPSVNYLMQATNAWAVRMGASARVSGGYGTRDFFRVVDSNAPPIDREQFKRGPIEPVPYISKVYPITYYWLVSIPVALAGPSVTLQFFVARAMSPLLFGVGLFFTWLILCELGVQRRSRLIILACSAFFPLATYVGGYVQPDNLAFTLVSISIYFALRTLSKPKPISSFCLVLALALLSITKQHFFVATALAVAVALLAGSLNRHLRVFGLGVLAAIIVTSAGATAFANMYKSAPHAHIIFCNSTKPHTGVSLGRASPHNFSDSIHVAQETILDNLRDSYSFETFWFAYGAHDYLILPKTSSSVEALWKVVEFAVVLTALLALTAIYFNLKRIIAVSIRKSWRTGLSIATHNVLLNAYFVYFGLLVIFASTSDGSVALKGRYFFPFIPAVWCLALYGARNAFPRRVGNRAIGFFQSALILYCMIFSTAAWASIGTRFYAPGPAPSPGDIFARFYVGRGRAPVEAKLGSFSSKASIPFRGVAVDLRNSTPVKEVFLKFDDMKLIRANRAANPDYACDNGDQRLLWTGFTSDIRGSRFRPGTHRVQLYVRPNWSTSPVNAGTRGTFEIVR